jgi:hypothetical protein
LSKPREDWQRGFALLMNEQPALRTKIESQITRDIPESDSLLQIGIDIGYRKAWLEIFRWYKREVDNIDVARLAPRGTAK